MHKIMVMGSFDVLHLGHIRLLKTARLLGEEVIAVVSDDNLASQKGIDRPRQSFQFRSAQLLELDLVDRIIPNSGPNARLHVENEKPDIVLLGIDYINKEIPSEDIVKSYGGKLLFLDAGIDCHTTDILDSRMVGENEDTHRGVRILERN